jgi:Ran GTPase-activating protein (RanGAP) involved in mRNA processing and transport
VVFHFVLLEVKLANNKIEDNGVTKLSEAIKNSKQFEVLMVGRCDVGSAGVKAIASVISISKA